MYYIGIDNGVGTIGIIKYEFNDEGMLTTYESDIHETPIKKELNYTKSKQYISRLDTFHFAKIFPDVNKMETIIALERPMVNPGRFKATAVGLRIFEAMLVTLEWMNFNYQYIDSKEWQRALLPKKVKGSAELKKASKQVGKRLFPHLKDKIKSDADGLLIAEYLRRKYNGEL